jgi:hypothetical protein
MIIESESRTHEAGNMEQNGIQFIPIFMMRPKMMTSSLEAK